MSGVPEGRTTGAPDPIPARSEPGAPPPVESTAAAWARADVSFIVTPLEAEAHFVREHDGVVRDAGEVERRRARMRREFGVDVV